MANSFFACTIDNLTKLN